MQPKLPKDPGCERKLKDKDYEMNLQDVYFENFENAIKKYGYRGQVTEKHFQAVSLDRKYLRTSDLSSYTSRISLYFNSDLAMIQDKGKFM
mmetsp:Transcript_9433/g.14463  ORF Transcript_9433/g.14463 Transcript_9433/m.14463 type:complete len:91 (-) Transcript_9433:573-845(-)